MKISSSRHLLRHQRLRQLVEEIGGPSKLADLAGTPKTHISALLHGTRGLGDKLAAKLERATGRPGFFDSAADASMPFRDLAPLEALLVSYFRDLTPERQQAVVMELRAAPNVVSLPTAAPKVTPGLQKTALQKARSRTPNRKKGT